MPLPLPNLDDRRWPDLVNEGRALIPRFAPRWTDHNIHDPGISLLELFAWLTEMNLYRLNRVPDRHRRKFLALIGFGPQPPQAAQSLLTFGPAAGSGSVLLPAGVEFETIAPNGQAIPFRTLRDLTVSPVTLAAIQVDIGDGILQDRTMDWQDGLPLEPLGRNPKPGAALYLGFNDIPVGTPVTIAFLHQGAGYDITERQRIIAEAAAQQVACRRVLPDIPCNNNQAQPSESPLQLPAHHSARLAWQIFTNNPLDPWIALEPSAHLDSPALGQVSDDTRSLTLDGSIELNLPPTIKQTTLGQVASPLFYIRATLAAGTYDATPELTTIVPNSVVVEQAVPVYQTFTIPTGVTPAGTAPTPGTTSRLKFELGSDDSVGVLTFFDDPTSVPDYPDLLVRDYEAPTNQQPGRLVLELVAVGRGNGLPDQRIVLNQAPVQLESLVLYTHIQDTWQEWTRQDDLDASDRTDFHFVLEATTGEISFGDGERGRVPARGDLILAAYRTTLAAAGNLAQGQEFKLSDPLRPVRLTGSELDEVRMQMNQTVIRSRIPATGGAPEEGLASVIGRAVATQHAHERLQELCRETNCTTLDQLGQQRVLALAAPTRAINLLDIERIALDVPGTRIARARAWAGIHPAYPCLQAAGVVTLIILPDTPVARPEPSQGLLKAVRRYLDRRRMITMRLEVVGPHYLVVHVKVRLQARVYADPSRVREQIGQALDAFLDPRHGGPGGRGWPFGRDVYRTEVMQLVDGVPGVDYIRELTLQAGSGEPQCGNIPLCPTWLVTPGQHTIEVMRGRR